MKIRHKKCGYLLQYWNKVKMIQHYPVKDKEKFEEFKIYYCPKCKQIVDDEKEIMETKW